MSKQHDLTDDDRKLLEEIDQLIAHENKMVQETDSLYGFCAHLSSTIPRGDDGFQKSLESQLQVEIQHLQQVQMAEKQSQNTEDDTKFKNNTLKKKCWTGWIKQKIQRIFQHFPGGIIMPQTRKQKMGFVITIMLVIMLNLSISIPSLRAQIIDAIHEIFVGEHTIVKQIDPQSSEFKSKLNQPIPSDSLNGRWFMRTEIFNYSSSIYTTPDLDEAQAASNFRIKSPETLPEGYSLREIKLVISKAFLFYGGPGPDIIIVQGVVDNRFREKASTERNAYTFSGYFTSAPVKEVELEGQLKTAWLEGILVWEEDGISFSVGGLDLSEDEAISIAESLR